MNADALRVLAERAAHVEGRPEARLRQVHERIRTTQRRRILGAVAGVVVAVVLIVSASTSLFPLADPEPVPPAKPPPTPTRIADPDDTTSSAGQLVWARGSVIHLGDRRVDVGREVSQLHATDDGVVFVGGRAALPRTCRLEAGTGGCDALWFTDGSRTVRIGTVFGTPVRGFRIEFSNGGSTVVWFEPDTRQRAGDSYREVGEYVVYDTSSRQEVARFGTAESDVLAVYGDQVFWTPDSTSSCASFSTYYGECRRLRSVMRLDTRTGRRTEVSGASYVADRRHRTRMFSRPIRGEADMPGPVYDEQIGFLRQGDRLVPDDGGGDATTARISRTGELVRLRLPAAYHQDVELFFMESWLDDHRVVLSADNRGDLLVCRLPAGRCHVTLRGPRTPAQERVTDFGGLG